jgi:hypothetical protein
MVTLPVSAKVRHAESRDIQNDPGSGFGEILDLWRNGNYDELWHRTTSTGRQSKESFIRRIESAGRRPACCWEKLQDVTVTARDDRKATVQAKVGLEGIDGSTEFVTKRFKMVNEDGLWKMSMSDVLSLAENGKKKYRGHYGTKKQNITVYRSP